MAQNIKKSSYSFNDITKSPSPPNYSDFKNFPHSTDICYNCGNIVYRLTDSHRGESFCRECGIIKPELNFDISLTEENIRVQDEDLAKIFNTFTRIKTPKGYERQSNKFRRIEWLKERYDRTTEGNKDLWRKQAHYFNYIGVMNTHFKMTKKQQKDAKRLIHDIGNLRNLCKRCKYEIVVSAICVYVMKKDKRDIRLRGKNQNKFLIDTGLTQEKYSLILANMVQFFEERRFSHTETQADL